MKLLCTVENHQELLEKITYFDLKSTDFCIKPRSNADTYPTFGTIDYLRTPENFNYFKRCFLRGGIGYIVRGGQNEKN